MVFFDGAVVIGKTAAAYAVIAVTYEALIAEKPPCSRAVSVRQRNFTRMLCVFNVRAYVIFFVGAVVTVGNTGLAAA